MRVLDVAVRDQAGARRPVAPPALLGGGPGPFRLLRLRLAAGGEREDEVVVLAGAEVELDLEVVVHAVVDDPGTGPARPTEPGVADLAPPHAVVTRQTPDAPLSEVAAQRQHHPHPGIDLGLDASENRQPVATTRQTERLARLDHAVLGHPPAPPDQSARLVPSTPDVTGPRHDLVPPTATDQ